MTGKPLGPSWQQHIAGYFLLLDYTDVAILKESLEKGQPWFIGKGQDNFLVISENIIPSEQIDDPH